MLLTFYVPPEVLPLLLAISFLPLMLLMGYTFLSEAKKPPLEETDLQKRYRPRGLVSKREYVRIWLLLTPISLIVSTVLIRPSSELDYFAVFFITLIVSSSLTYCLAGAYFSSKEQRRIIKERLICIYGECKEPPPRGDWIGDIHPRLRCGATFTCDTCGAVFGSESNVEWEGSWDVVCPNCDGNPLCNKATEIRRNGSG